MAFLRNYCPLLIFLCIVGPSLTQFVPQQPHPVPQQPIQQHPGQLAPAPPVLKPLQPDVNAVNEECCKRGHEATTCDASSYKHVDHLNNDWNLYCQNKYMTCCHDKLRSVACGQGVDVARQGGDCGIVVESDPHKSTAIGCCVACSHGLRSPDLCATSVGSETADKTFLACCEEARRREENPIKGKVTHENPANSSVTKPSNQVLVQNDPSDKTEVKSHGTDFTFSGDPPKAAGVEDSEASAVDHEAVVITCPVHQVMDPESKKCVDTECKNASCPEHHTCTVMEGRVSCMTCKPGFQMSDGNCIDVNECDIEGNECEAQNRTCVNTVGGFECLPALGDEDESGTEPETENPVPDSSRTCETGFVIENGICVDVDECRNGEHRCMFDEKCVNTEGDHDCERIKCETGMKISENGTCVAKDACSEGFEFEVPADDCVDTDECKNNSTLCADGEVCVNREGSFDCVKNTCKPGFHMVHDTFDDSFKCKDVDECEENKHNCTSGQECSNLDGGYKCDCQPGFELNSATQSCEDVDECLSVTTCNASVSTCNNTIGSYDCVCNSGYEKSFTGSCNDVDECDQNPCTGNARCLNKQGSFECQCLPGWMRQDNTTCVPDGKDRICNGLFQANGTCACPEGFAMHTMEDRLDCHDVDECAEVDGKQQKCTLESQTCVNTFGGHECMEIICPDNYVALEGRKNWCRHTQLDPACLVRGFNCSKRFQDAATISYNFATVHNNPVLAKPAVLYELYGLPEDNADAIELDFINTMVEIQSANPYDKAEYVRDFRVDYNHKKEVTTVELLKPLTGPRHILIRIDAESRQMAKDFRLIHTAYLNVYVSRYNDHFNQGNGTRVVKG